ncbi:MAG: DUF1674 domain-containing protein [Rudaea sp.]
MQEPKNTADKSGEEANEDRPIAVVQPLRPQESGGRGGLEPTRYGDWEKNGRCIDF